MYQRYALYYTPEGAFASRGAAWLGYDIGAGRDVAQVDVAGLDVGAIAATPRKYGFHGTIKAPFALAEGCEAGSLIAEAATICAKHEPVRLDRLEVAALGRFLALIPLGDQQDLRELGAAVVEGLDTFRAPASEDELARRRRANLSPAQEHNLVRWGYPHVMDQFRFHMTLTGRLPKGQVNEVQHKVAAQFADFLPAPFIVDTISVAGERADGHFEEIARLPIGSEGGK